MLVINSEYIKDLRKKYSWSQEDLAKILGISRRSVSNWEAGTVIPKTKHEILHKLFEKGIDALKASRTDAITVGDLTGGEIERIKSGNEFIEVSEGQYLMIVPLVEEYAQAGYTAGFADKTFIEELPKHSIVVSQKHRGDYVAFRVTGDSMDNGSTKSICSGDIVVGRKIDKIHWNSRFHLHKFTDYIIVHKEGIICKTIVEHDVEKGIIKCHSKNMNNDSYPDFELHLSEVEEILNIVSVDRPWR